MSKTIHLKPEIDRRLNYLSERRDDWICYEVIHSGEGPCRRPVKCGGVRPILAEDAASQYAEIMSQRDRREGCPAEHGDEFYVAVETREGYALYFVVRLVIIERFDSTPSEVEVSV